jgi:hypothetical protein
MKRKQPSKSNAGPTIGNLDLEQIEQLLSYMSEHNLEEFEYENGEVKIRLKKPDRLPCRQLAHLPLLRHRRTEPQRQQRRSRVPRICMS